MKKLVFLLSCLVVWHANYAQISFDAGVSYSAGSPAEITGYDRDYTLSYALDAITEDVVVRRGGFTRGIMVNAGIRKQYKSGFLFHLSGEQMIRPSKQTLNERYNYYDHEYVNFGSTYWMDHTAINPKVGYAFEALNDISVAFLMGPRISRTTVHEKILISSSLYKEWEEFNARYVSSISKGWNFTIDYSQKLLPRLSYNVQVSYISWQFSPKKYYLDSYLYSGIDQTEDIPLSRREIDLSDEARITYDKSFDLQESETSPGTGSSFNMPTSTFQFGLGLVYVLRANN